MKIKTIICITFILMSAIVSAQSYIQVDRTYSGSGVDKKLKLTVRNLSSKQMVIRNQTEHCPECSCVRYKYLNKSGTVLYDEEFWGGTLGNQYLTIIPAKSSKSFIYPIGAAAYNLSNKNDIKTIQLHFWIDYSILGLKNRDIFDTTVRIAF